jgi:hypothetical protein
MQREAKLAAGRTAQAPLRFNRAPRFSPTRMRNLDQSNLLYD